MQQLDVQVQSQEGRLDVLESGQFSGNLHVDGSAEFEGNLTVQGIATLSELIVVGNTTLKQLTVDRIISHGDVPAAVLGATTGLSATASVTGNDTAGKIEYVAGTQTLPTHPLGAGEQVTVNFHEAYAAAPTVTLTPTSEKAASVRYYVTQTVDGFKLVFLDTPLAGETYSFNYQVIQ